MSRRQTYLDGKTERIKRECQRVIFSNGEKGWNSTKSEFALILNKNKVGQVEKNIEWQNNKSQHTLWNTNKKKKQD